MMETIADEGVLAAHDPAEVSSLVQMMLQRSAVDGAVRFADFLSVMDSCCAQHEDPRGGTRGDQGSSFHSRLRGALQDLLADPEQAGAENLQLTVATTSEDEEDGEDEEEAEEVPEEPEAPPADPFHEWSKLIPFATGELRPVVRHHRIMAQQRGQAQLGRRRSGSQPVSSDSDDDAPVDTADQIHERRLVRKHLSKMLGGRDVGPASMERTEQFITRWIGRQDEDPVIAELYARAEQRMSRNRAKERTQASESDDSSDDDGVQAVVMQRALAQALRATQLEHRLHTEEVARRQAEAERDEALEHLAALKLRHQWERSRGFSTAASAPPLP
jgi:hypothetical protein